MSSSRQSCHGSTFMCSFSGTSPYRIAKPLPISKRRSAQHGQKITRKRARSLSECNIAKGAPSELPVAMGDYASPCDASGNQLSVGVPRPSCPVETRGACPEAMQEGGEADALAKPASAKSWRSKCEAKTYLESLCRRLQIAEPSQSQTRGPNPREPEIPETWHRQLVEWLLNFPRDADVQNGTIAVAVNFMQRFLTVRQVSKRWLQLLAMVCTFVASKVNETHGEKCITMRFLTEFVANRRYNSGHIKLLERKLLKTLKWNLHPVTAHALTMVMLELYPDQQEREQIMEVANVVLDLQLPSKKNLEFSTKAIALGCISAACSITGHSNKHVLSEIEHLVTPEEVECGEQMKVTLCRMFFNIFPDYRDPRACSPTSVTGAIPSAP